MDAKKITRPQFFGPLDRQVSPLAWWLIRAPWTFCHQNQTLISGNFRDSQGLFGAHFGGSVPNSNLTLYDVRTSTEDDLRKTRANMWRQQGSVHVDVLMIGLSSHPRYAVGAEEWTQLCGGHRMRCSPRTTNWASAEDSIQIVNTTFPA